MNWGGIGVVGGSCRAPKTANTLVRHSIQPPVGLWSRCQQTVAKKSTTQRRSMYPWTLKHVVVPSMPQQEPPPLLPPPDIMLDDVVLISSET